MLNVTCLLTMQHNRRPPVPNRRRPAAQTQTPMADRDRALHDAQLNEDIRPKLVPLQTHVAGPDYRLLFKFERLSYRKNPSGPARRPGRRRRAGHRRHLVVRWDFGLFSPVVLRF